MSPAALAKLADVLECFDRRLSALENERVVWARQYAPEPEQSNPFEPEQVKPATRQD